MIRSAKPVRKCHACPLNLGDRCWGYSNPRAKWKTRRVCPGFSDSALHRLYQLWCKQATVKTRREIRRECIHHLPPVPVHYLEKKHALHLQGLRDTFGL